MYHQIKRFLLLPNKPTQLSEATQSYFPMLMLALQHSCLISGAQTQSGWNKNCDQKAKHSIEASENQRAIFKDKENDKQISNIF